MAILQRSRDEARTPDRLLPSGADHRPPVEARPSRCLTACSFLAVLLATTGCASTSPTLGEDPEVRVFVLLADFTPEIHNPRGTGGRVGAGATAGAARLGREAMNDCSRSVGDPLGRVMLVPLCGLMGATIGGVAGGAIAGAESATHSIPEEEEVVLRMANRAAPPPGALRAYLFARLAHDAERRGRRLSDAAVQKVEVHVGDMRWVFGVGDTAAIEATFTVRSGVPNRTADRSFTLITERRKVGRWAERGGAPVAEALEDLIDRGSRRVWIALDGAVPGDASGA